MNLHHLLALADREGFDALYLRDSKTGHISKGSPVVVSRFVRGRGTESISSYRTVNSGNVNDPWHVELSFERGYSMSNLHSSDWPFSLDGKTKTTPLADPGTKWACFGSSWDCKNIVDAQNRTERVAEEHREETATSMRQPSGPIRLKSGKNEKSVTKYKPFKKTKIPAELLIAKLTANSGSVLDRNVKVIDTNRFKSYYDTLLSAYKSIGGTHGGFEEELRRGEVEVVSEQGGYGGRGVGGSRSAQIVEYVVHSGLRLA